MSRRLLGAAAAGLVAFAAGGALAADPTISTLPLTAGLTTYNEAVYSDGSHIWLGHLNYGWTGSAPKAFAVDPTTGYLGVNVFTLPTIPGIGVPSDAACTPGSACSAEANFRLMTSQLDAALTKLDTALAALASIQTSSLTTADAATDPSSTLVNDPNNAAYSGVTDMPTDAATYTAGRGFQSECAVAGNVKVTLSDTSVRTIPVSIGLNIEPYAVTAWTESGVTGAATCTHANLK